MATRIRVGVLNDMCDGPPPVGDLTTWLEREVAAVQAAGRLDAEVEWLPAYGHGLPTILVCQKAALAHSIWRS